MTVRLKLEPWREEGEMVELAAVLEGGGRRQRVWWRVPAQWRGAVTQWADPFVAGLIFPMMIGGEEVRVEGRASPSLLENLERYMAAWQVWKPERYRAVRITADEEMETPLPDHPNVLMPFSCGVDSSFTALRHHRQLVGRRSRRIEAGVLFRGFDIQRRDPHSDAMYEKLLASAQAMLGSLGMTLLTAETNLRDSPIPWEDIHASTLASGLLLFSGRFAGALIPSSLTLAQLGTIWGSHPMTDGFLGSRNFPLWDDGAEAARWEKMALLGTWPQGWKHLRICFKDTGDLSNCCVCDKCIRTLLAARVAEVGLPALFHQDVDNRDIRKMLPENELIVLCWEELLQGVKRAGKHRTGWGKAVAKVVARGRRRMIYKNFNQRFVPLRNKLRKTFRGTELSRGEIALRAALVHPNESPKE